ncbi:MAG TPA: helix-turn-helix domain-containing protein [Chloroflexota bacterium]|jgi:predicted ATPase/DNA-binding XRE family transcriptional regulator|nr:helix-turn-helix domain-containing protein [Chloroflexota bacterium]
MQIKPAALHAFGPMLKRFRREVGMSQVELASAAGFSMVYISMLERGKRKPPATTIDMLAEALALPAADRARLTETIAGSRRATPAGLPASVTSFVGREVEVALVSEMFRNPGTRLVTLLGPGGVGKTRLATEVAREIQFDVAAGAVFVPLDSISSSDDVAGRLVQALGIARQPGVSPDQLLQETVQDRSILVVLDNFEHVLAAGTLVGKLLAAGPNIRVLATSRSPLDIYGEQVFRVEPLSNPAPGTPEAAGEMSGLNLLRVTASSDAARLFVDRAEAADSTFRLTKDTASAVARICHTLDGLPLAIELAAARVRHYPVGTVADKLNHSLAALTGRATMAGERHHSLKNVFSWSYQLLDPRSRAVFGRLSLFSGGFTLEAAESVCRFDGETEVEPVVVGLMDASLVQRAVSSGNGSRFRMLQTVREFAGECLAGGDDAEKAGRRHFEYYLALAQRTAPALWSVGSVPVEMDDEAANMQLALDWSHKHCPWDGLRLASPLADYADFRGQARSGLEWLQKMLSAAGAMSSRPLNMPIHEARMARAKALISAAGLATHVGEIEVSETYAAEGLAMFQRMGDKRRLAWALNVSSFPALYDGRHQRAWEFLEQSLAVYRKLNDATGILQVTGTLGAAAALLGDYRSAAALLEESLDLSRQANNLVAAARAMNNLGYVLVKLGDNGRAGTLARESLVVRNNINDPRGIIESLELLAVLARQASDHSRAARLLGASHALRRHYSVAATVAYARILVAESSDAAIGELGRDQFDSQFAEGSAMSLKQAVRVGLESTTRLTHNDATIASRVNPADR